MKVLVTGAAGFIGFHVAQRLLARGMEVIGVDTLNTYYDPVLKQARLQQLETLPGFAFYRADIADHDAMNRVIDDNRNIRIVVHLAAQAGVRYSLIDPYSYVTTNVMGQVVLLEACRKLDRLEHFIYASSSSVYGRNQSLPFRESDRVDMPGSLYAVTKRAGELTATAYAHLHGIPQTGLRFFTVYGPWGRPDMAYYGFAKAICERRPLTLYEGKSLSRDFTYIDDITAGVLAVIDHPATSGEARLFNLGSDRREPVKRLIELLEQTLGHKAIVEYRQRPVADMEATWASLEKMESLCGWRPQTPLENGIPVFSVWFRKFHKL